MGTSGDRLGYKEFSINTTIRNPRRNTEFLKLLKRYEGVEMDDGISYSFLFDLVQNGVYQQLNVSESVREKWESGSTLSNDEVKKLIKDNPQATGQKGRIMTMLRALKDQGFIILEKSGRNNTVYFSELGNALVDGNIDEAIIYTKAMIGLHANNPVRHTMLNESRPFLNALFVINEVDKKWEKLGNISKGVLKHEFGAFILTMKDCDYKKCADEIIKYRKLYGYEINEDYIEDYFKRNSILDLKIESATKDYPDEVFRKFEMTDLIISHGKFNYVYYDISKYNFEKASMILEQYKDYKFESFSSMSEYYEYLNSIVLPWENDVAKRRRIVEAKENILKIHYDDSVPLERREEQLDAVFNTNELHKSVDKYDEEFIKRELLILGKQCKEKSKFDDIPEPLRLEYLIALYIGKKYGLEGLISNISYDGDGKPKHCAPGGKADIMFYHKDGYYIFEPTMQTNRDQQLNTETTSVSNHALSERKKYNAEFRVAMIAPRVHRNVAEFFKFQASLNKIKMTTISICRLVDLIYTSEEVCDLNVNFDEIVDEMLHDDLNDFVDKTNFYVAV